MSDWGLAGRSEFHEQAAEELRAYAQLARDVARSLPPEEWPIWARNQLRTQGLLDDQGLFVDPNPGIMREGGWRYAQEAPEEDVGQEQEAPVAPAQETAQGPLEEERAVEYAWPEWEDIDAISRQAVVPHQGYQGREGIDKIMGAVGNTRTAQGYGAHQDIFHTAADLIAKVQRQQAVVEGNKRTATALGLNWLQQHGYNVSHVATEPAWSHLVEAIWLISDAAHPEGDAAIQRVAQILRENCVPEHTASLGDWVQDMTHHDQYESWWNNLDVEHKAALASWAASAMAGAVDTLASPMPGFGHGPVGDAAALATWIAQRFSKTASDWFSDSNDLWSGPAQVNLEQGVGVPGEADGMGDTMTTDSDPVSDNWVYLDGTVVGGGPHWDLAEELARQLGTDETQAKQLGNLVARGQLPPDRDIAIGSVVVRRGKRYPQVWVSTVDRNAVWDAVAGFLNGPGKTSARWRLVASGDYETEDGRFRMYQLIGVRPPAWNVEDNETYELVVDGAASKRDAAGLFDQWMSSGTPPDGHRSLSKAIRGGPWPGASEWSQRMAERLTVAQDEDWDLDEPETGWQAWWGGVPEIAGEDMNYNGLPSAAHGNDRRPWIVTNEGQLYTGDWGEHHMDMPEVAGKGENDLGWIESNMRSLGVIDGRGKVWMYDAGQALPQDRDMVQAEVDAMGDYS